MATKHSFTLKGRLGGVSLLGAPHVLEQMTGKLGYPESLMTTLGVLELGCLALYLVPNNLRDARLRALLPVRRN
jgi:hypothetical protein